MISAQCVCGSTVSIGEDGINKPMACACVQRMRLVCAEALPDGAGAGAEDSMSNQASGGKVINVMPYQASGNAAPAPAARSGRWARWRRSSDGPPTPRGEMQRDLVERARRGDHDAFAELARRRMLGPTE